MLLHINENIDLGEEGLKKLFFALFCLSRNICNSKLKTGSWRTFLIELIIRNGPILFGDWTVLSWVISSCIIKMTFSFRNRVPNRKANMSTVEHLVIHGATILIVRFFMKPHDTNRASTFKQHDDSRFFLIMIQWHVQGQLCVKNQLRENGLD